MSAFDGEVDVEVAAEFGAGPLDSGLTYPDDLSGYVKAADWMRGKSPMQDAFPAGQGTLILDNSAGRFYSFDTGSPYSPDVKPGVPIRIRAVHNSIIYDLFYGYVDSWESPFPTDREELVTVPIVETYARLIRKWMRTSFNIESTDERIAAILDVAGWPAAARDLDVGVAEVAALFGVESPVGHRLNETVIAEQGALFQAANGDIRFKNRVANSGVTPSATFGPTAPDLIYTDVTYEDNQDLLFNEAVVSGNTGEVVEVSDATSVNEHGPITYPQIDSLDIRSGPEALNVAEWIVGKHKDLTRRITGFTIDPAGDPDNLWPEVLSRDLCDVVTVKVGFPGASVTFDQDLAVEQITHKFVVGDVWTVEYNLRPVSALETLDFWVLGTSELGIDTVLA